MSGSKSPHVWEYRVSASSKTRRLRPACSPLTGRNSGYVWSCDVRSHHDPAGLVSVVSTSPTGLSRKDRLREWLSSFLEMSIFDAADVWVQKDTTMSHDEPVVACVLAVVSQSLGPWKDYSEKTVTPVGQVSPYLMRDPWLPTMPLQRHA